MAAIARSKHHTRYDARHQEHQPRAPASLGPRNPADAPLLMAVGGDPETLRLLQVWARRRGFRWRACSSSEAARGVAPELLFLLEADASDDLDRLRRLARDVILVVSPEQLPARCRQRPAEGVHLLCRPLDWRFVDRLLGDLAADFQCDLRYRRPGHRRPPPLDRFANLHGSATIMKELFARMRRIAAGDGAVLVYGERGTGKARAARGLHDEGRRAAGPFVLVDGRNLSDGAGGAEGSSEFWLEQLEHARGGSLFVNHLCALPPAAQISLLRALEVAQRAGLRSLRLIAAVNGDPLTAIAAGSLRQDLYDRLAAFVLRLPPLRERRHDVVGLAWWFLDELNQRHGTAKRLSPEAAQAMSGHAWPGNVRELRNVLEYAHGGHGHRGVCAHAGCSDSKCAHDIGPDLIGPGNLPLAVGGGDPFADGESGQLRDVV
ncbi:MAG: sigma-54-dependent transcriptional regulator [Pseudomonadales bacterium]